MRDTYMMKTPARAREVERYYQIAPAIVEAVESSETAGEVWADLCRRYIVPCIELVRRGDNAAAYRVYREMVNELAHQWLATSPDASGPREEPAKSSQS